MSANASTLRSNRASRSINSPSIAHPQSCTPALRPTLPTPSVSTQATPLPLRPPPRRRLPSRRGLGAACAAAAGEEEAVGGKEDEGEATMPLCAAAPEITSAATKMLCAATRGCNGPSICSARGKKVRAINIILPLPAYTSRDQNTKVLAPVKMMQSDEVGAHARVHACGLCAHA